MITSEGGQESGAVTPPGRPVKPRTKKPRAPRTVKPEQAFQASIIALCDGRDLWPIAVNPERFPQRTACNRGFPDLEIHGPGGVLYRELKMSRLPYRGLSSSQITWRDRLKSSGQDWAIWTPAEFRDGTIENQLAAIETPRETSSVEQQFAAAMLGTPADAGTDPSGEPAGEPGEARPSRPARTWVALGIGAVIAVAITRSR